MKKCCKCGKRKPLSKFVKRSDRKGYYVWCRVCQAAHGREPGWPPSDIRGGGLVDGGLKNLLETE